MPCGCSLPMFAYLIRRTRRGFVTELWNPPFCFWHAAGASQSKRAHRTETGEGKIVGDGDQRLRSLGGKERLE